MRILVVCRDRVGSRMAGPGVRSLRFAEELARRRHDVTLTVPVESDLEPRGFRLVVADPWDAVRLTELGTRMDAVVAQWLPVSTMRRLAASHTRAVYDLYDPWTIEELARDRTGAPDSGRAAAHRLARVVQGETLARGDAFVCASERQRDFWLGWLAARGRVGPAEYERDPSLRSLIDVVPFGVDAEPPRAGEPVLRGVVEGIGESDRVLLWGGGIWEWLDAETVIRAVGRLAERRPEVRLFFLGVAPPNLDPARADAARGAVELSAELGLTGRHVFFNDAWVPHAERAGYLLESDAGVVAHFDDVETRLAFRTRLLDYVWAGLPIVTTGGDALADEVERLGLGGVVAERDVDGWVAALDAVLRETPEARGAREAALAGLRASLAWPQVVEPLLRLLEGGAVAPRPRTLDPARAGYLAARLRNALATHGVRGSAERLVSRAANRSST